MATISNIVVSTRTALARADELSLLEMLVRTMNMKPGDYLEYRGSGSDQWRTCRVDGVDQIYINKNGGYTARLKVSRLRTDGRIGVGRTMTIAKTPSGKLKAVTGAHEVRRREFY
jgi:hypothetical protein